MVCSIITNAELYHTILYSTLYIIFYYASKQAFVAAPAPHAAPALRAAGPPGTQVEVGVYGKMMNLMTAILVIY